MRCVAGLSSPKTEEASTCWQKAASNFTLILPQVRLGEAFSESFAHLWTIFCASKEVPSWPLPLPHGRSWWPVSGLEGLMGCSYQERNKRISKGSAWCFFGVEFFVEDQWSYPTVYVVDFPSSPVATKTRYNKRPRPRPSPCHNQLANKFFMQVQAKLGQSLENLESPFLVDMLAISSYPMALTLKILEVF